MQRYPLILLLTLITFSGSVLANSHWYFRSDFSSEEQQRLKSWVSETKSGIEKLIAPYPFDTHFVFYRRHQQREPVPWANTERDRVQGVHFYVDTGFGLSRFQQDWTASHEVAHLLIPWLGDNHRWLAEGFASYLQYPIMYVNGHLTWDDAIERYKRNLELAAKHNSTRTQSIAQVSKRMHATRAYKVVYWGGALYFMRVDRQLYQEKNIRLFDVIAQYQNCCRQGAEWGDSGFYELIKTLDRLSESSLFSESLPPFTSQSGFPEYHQDLKWLKMHAPGL